jgi:phage tail sheath protein FI
LADGGADYDLNDVVTIAGGTATATVTAVDLAGAATTVVLTAAGAGYAVGTNVATTGGAGTGLLVDITAVTSAWDYRSLFPSAPSTSDYWNARNPSVVDTGNDEVHVVVVDVKGRFSGLSGQVLERFAFASKIASAKKEDGSTNYWVDLVNKNSKYVRVLATNVPASMKSTDESTVFATNVASVTETTQGGADGDEARDDDIIVGYDLFSNAEVVSVSLLPIGAHSAIVAQYVIQNICEVRKDCVAFVSPAMDSVVNYDPTSVVEDIKADREALLLSSSYGVMDCNWKLMYDKYNDTNRWVPCNGDVAGCCVRTDSERDPWWSPAGLNRGQIKNVIKLAFNPDKADRDDLYLASVNSIVSLPGQGVVLFGDKTLLSKPSAFDRINVRRLFIVLEKAIALAARYFLFEFNDAFTRAQFKAMVEPYLARVKAARGIYDFRVVCDETNNTGEVIDHNQFVGDIYVKPARSINFINLNFIAVRTGVAFEEVVGKF